MRSADRSDAPTGSGLDDDLISFLTAAGAATLPHARGRSLLDHLTGTAAILRRWGQPEWLARAALIHSVYGSDRYAPRLLARTERARVEAIAGPRAERLAHLFSVTPRGPLFAGVHRWARGLPAHPPDATGTDVGADEPPATRAELDALVVLHMANRAEQASAADGSPGRWLVALRELSELLDGGEDLEPPVFVHALVALSAQDEAAAVRRYHAALAADGLERTGLLALVASACPVVAEPCVWLAHAAASSGDDGGAAAWAAQARRRLELLGAAWDKRLGFEEWEQVIASLQRPGNPPDPHSRRDRRDPSDRRDATHPRHPRELLRPPERRPATAAGRRGRSPGEDDGRRRFERYVESLAVSPEGSSAAPYPDLPARPWHDPAEFPLARRLEDDYPSIRQEILALQAFQREAEPIARAGEWDVAFLYERGRRNQRNCAACPVTTAAIEAHATVRTMAGLSYVSRMRPGTHIAPHRGPTNLRLRCHLGIVVPDGDCAIRVADETRRWEEGRCLVFDDFLEHEAWNHAGGDRLVLIVDLWHPGLSPVEIRLLEGLHDYVHRHAIRLGRYWAANARAAGEAQAG